MAPWTVTALLLSAQFTAAGPTSFAHVRSAEPALRALIADGHARSPTLRTLVDAVEGRSCIVYVQTTIVLSPRIKGAMLLQSVGLREIPVLRVLVRPGLSRDETIAVIAHELQHVLEATAGAPVGDGAAMAAVFARLHIDQRRGGTHRFETDQALRVSGRVRDELTRARR